MPKEITYSDQPEYVLLKDGSEVDPDSRSGRGLPILRRAAIVGWSKETGFVEIGINALEIGTQQGSGVTGMYATFDRAGINRLIKTLRRARDAVYGRDE